MSNHRNWERVESAIKALVEEAKEVLKKSKFPTSYAELMAFKKEPSDRLILEAELVVHAEYYLKKAIEHDMADEAALRMLSLLVAYLDMVDLREVPDSEEWKKLGSDENEVQIKGLRAGLKNLLGNKN